MTKGKDTQKRRKTTGKGLLAGLLSAVLVMSVPAAVTAAESTITITQQKGVLYSNDKTVVYARPDYSSLIITGINPNLPVQVTGITSNGWFEIALNGTYYVPGYGLQEQAAQSSTGRKEYTEAEIKQLVSGTFSFYDNAQLRAFTVEEVEEMDANTYLKYLDSFLIGNALAEYCIVQEDGLTLKAAYEQDAAADASIAVLSLKSYLAAYRNQYLEDSLWGPVRSEKELTVTVNRAIRYGISSFSTVYKNAIIGSEQVKMDKVLSTLISEIKAQQGISFSYKMSYGSYQTSEGSSSSGWIIELTREGK